MSDFGFDDEASRRRRTASSDADFGRPVDAAPRPRRPKIGALVAVAVLVLLGLVGWSWSNRLHADDLDAYLVMRNHVTDIERAFDPVGQGLRDPCGVTDEGWRELTWPDANQTSVGMLQAYAIQHGWTPDWPQISATKSVLHRSTSDHTITLTIVADDARGTVLTATSSASAFGCFLR